MLTAIITTAESERTLVRTLAALVPGATAGLIAEVVVADANSNDATEEVADIAGCRYLASAAPLGIRLADAVRTTRTPWLMFLRAGTEPATGWVDIVDRFIAETDPLDGAPRAAVFRPSGPDDLTRPRFSDLFAMLRLMIGGGVTADQGLVIARRFYDAVGGHTSSETADAQILRTLGRKRIVMLPCAARITHSV